MNTSCNLVGVPAQVRCALGVEHIHFCSGQECRHATPFVTQCYVAMLSAFYYRFVMPHHLSRNAMMLGYLRYTSGCNDRLLG